MKPTKYFSNKQEKAVAKSVGGKVTSGSGGGKFEKTDVLLTNFAIECKTAVEERKSFSIKKDWIDKLREQAFSMRKSHWALAFNFGGVDAENYYIISECDFNLLKEMVDDEAGS